MIKAVWKREDIGQRKIKTNQKDEKNLKEKERESEKDTSTFLTFLFPDSFHRLIAGAWKIPRRVSFLVFLSSSPKRLKERALSV